MRVTGSRAGPIFASRFLPAMSELSKMAGHFVHCYDNVGITLSAAYRRADECRQTIQYLPSQSPVFENSAAALSKNRDQSQAARAASFSQYAMI
jgi:hypothetical protein